jgi:hypothetical protein
MPSTNGSTQSEQSAEKRAYVKEILTGNPRLDDRTLGQLVESKFGSGLARRNMDEVRRDLGWVWKSEPGKRSRTLVQVSTRAANTNTEPPAAPAQTAPVVQSRPAPALTEDERREVELINELQALMLRQGYREIVIPATGTAHIRLLVVREKNPGEHVENAVH